MLSTALYAALHHVLAPRLPRMTPRAFRARISRGLVGAFHVQLDDPRYGSPSRDYLTNPEVAPVVRRVVEHALKRSPRSWIPSFSTSHPVLGFAAMADNAKLKFARLFAANVPHNRALGIEIVEFTTEAVLFKLPYDDKLVGHPDTGTLHGGAITALLDGASGAAVFASLVDMVPIATLDLRIDYLRPAEPGKPVLASASCYKMTKHVAFTRAVAYHDDPENPIAHSVGTFMVSTRGGPK